MSDPCLLLFVVTNALAAIPLIAALIYMHSFSFNSQRIKISPTSHQRTSITSSKTEQICTELKPLPPTYPQTPGGGGADGSGAEAE